MAGLDPTGCTHLFEPHIQPSSPRNGFAVIARGAARLRGVSKDGPGALVADPSRRGQQAAPRDEGSVGRGPVCALIARPLLSGASENPHVSWLLPILPLCFRKRSGFTGVFPFPPIPQGACPCDC